MEDSLVQKVALEAKLVWRFLKEEIVRIAVTVFLEGSFIGAAAYFKVTDMWTLFYISVSVAAISGFFLLIHWFIVLTGRSRKEFERDMRDLMEILAVVNLYRGEKLYMGRITQGDMQWIYEHKIVPQLMKEREEISRYLETHLPDMTPRRKHELMSKLYELSTNSRDISN